MGPFSPPQSQLHICTVSVTSPHLLFAPSPFSVHSHSSPLASRLSYRVFFFPHPIFPPHFLKLNASRKTIRALCQRLNTVFIDRSQSTSLPQQHPLLTQTTYSIAGDSKWAASPNFDVSATEMKEIINGLSGKVDALYAEGLHVGGERYVLTKAEDRSLYARKGREGVVIVKTKQAILIAHYGESILQGTQQQPSSNSQTTSSSQVTRAHSYMGRGRVVAFRISQRDAVGQKCA